MRRIAADAAETPSKSSERAPPSPPTEFYSGSESGDELRGYDPPHGFGVDVATLRQLCEATPGEGRVARISALGGLDELARRLRADTVSGLATAPREDTSGLHVVDADARSRTARDAGGAALCEYLLRRRLVTWRRERSRQNAELPAAALPSTGESAKEKARCASAAELLLPLAASVDDAARAHPLFFLEVTFACWDEHGRERTIGRFSHQSRR